jgi:hypothetical protein
MRSVGDKDELRPAVRGNGRKSRPAVGPPVGLAIQARQSRPPRPNEVRKISACCAIRRRPVAPSATTRKRDTPRQVHPSFFAMIGARRAFRSTPSPFAQHLRSWPSPRSPQHGPMGCARPAHRWSRAHRTRRRSPRPRQSSQLRGRSSPGCRRSQRGARQAAGRGHRLASESPGQACRRVRWRLTRGRQATSARWSPVQSGRLRCSTARTRVPGLIDATNA